MTERRPLGNVLVATDFSGAATSAVERAARLPISPGSALTILHVLPPGCRPEDRADAERALGYAVSVARDVAARAGRKDVDVFPRLVEGTPFVEIIRTARHGRNELIVIGRHGERTFRELLLGSTAERVIRKGDTSILVVASRLAAPYERPLVALDCSDTSRRAVELAWRLADPKVQTLEVVHAYHALSERSIRDAGFSAEAVLEYQREAKQRAQAAVGAFLGIEAAPPARVLLREGDAAHVLLGSVAEAVIRAASCDVLVARAVGFPFKLP
jgi:nucleotide-binding universal stress UspA family protein